jgi:hypothetical protein
MTGQVAEGHEPTAIYRLRSMVAVMPTPPMIMAGRFDDAAGEHGHCQYPPSKQHQ